MRCENCYNTLAEILVKRDTEIQQLRNRVVELEEANKLLAEEAERNHDFIQKVWLAHPNVDLDIDFAMENNND